MNIFDLVSYDFLYGAMFYVALAGLVCCIIGIATASNLASRAFRWTGRIFFGLMLIAALLLTSIFLKWATS